jgi:hypothetical protein
MQVVWSMLKAKHYESDVDELQKVLDLYQGQLHMQLSWLTQYVKHYMRTDNLLSADLEQKVAVKFCKPGGCQNLAAAKPT